MIDSSSEIPSIMKLQYLLSSLKGDASLLFEHTTLTADNYAVTWSALLKRYDNPRMLIRDYLRKIHHLPAVKTESVDELAQLVDEFTCHVNGLKKLNEPVDNWDSPLTTMMFFKLHPSTMLAWEKHSSHHPRDMYMDLIDFLQDRIIILRSTRTFAQDLEVNQRMVDANEQNVAVKPRSAVNAAAPRNSFHGYSHQPACQLGCVENHNLRSCAEFGKADIQHRREVVAKERLCYNCLNPNHQVKSSSPAANPLDYHLRCYRFGCNARNQQHQVVGVDNVKYPVVHYVPQYGAQNRPLRDSSSDKPYDGTLTSVVKQLTILEVAADDALQTDRNSFRQESAVSHCADGTELNLSCQHCSTHNVGNKGD
ncbi:uncharacterized protein LOC125769469 [Anopheles funestus]|uniref:uncharacterized protein LOC125769469 n=1 Tax=Anopheles funestus TaxID=62324 RepID=UPI0020C64C09|nr:uncharacterized protein LOC125769469 [Anopheles funestus]